MHERRENTYPRRVSDNLLLAPASTPQSTLATKNDIGSVTRCRLNRYVSRELSAACHLPLGGANLGLRQPPIPRAILT